MQTAGVVADAESAGFAMDVLAPEGFTLGRHVGPPDTHRKMHPVTMYRLAENAPQVTREVDHMLLWMDNTFYETRRDPKFTALPGSVLLALLEILVFVALLLGWRLVTSSKADRNEAQ